MWLTSGCPEYMLLMSVSEERERERVRADEEGLRM